MVFLFFLAFSLLFATSLDKIKNISRENLDKAIDMFLDYVKGHPKDPDIEKVGEFLFAKKHLVEKYPFLAKEIVSEDLKGFLKKLKTFPKTFSSKETKLLEKIFPDLKSFIEDLQSVEDILIYPSFWKLGIPLRIKDPESFVSKLIERFFEDPFLLSYEFITALSKIENSKELGEKIVSNVEKMPLQEKNYPYMLRLFEIARMLGYNRPSDLEEELRNYFLLSAKLSASSSPKELEELVTEYEKLTIPKEELRKKLLVFSSKVKRENSEDHRYYYLLILFLPFLFFFSSRFRAQIYRIFGAKKRAASLYLKLLQKYPENVKLRLKLAHLYEELGMHEEAMKEYEIIKKLSQV
ncbi:lipopolysaccharide assembly protein LapB [Thermotoga sp. KOL6]|uniref:tetratricopeptide repeat protein n=1 Tax=Thermotoga sp. KOL6 TaxID=126741 RepID=UPI001E3A2BBB|nr:tetratricopeptide repeat protein [Thermotoga sp. KOL6]